MPNSSILERSRYGYALKGLNRVISCAHQQPAFAAFSLSLAVICLDYWLAPALNVVTPLVGSAVLVVLLLRRSSHAVSTQPVAALVPGKWRVLSFLFLHLILVTGFLIRPDTNRPAPHAAGLFALALTLAKYLVLLPTVVLLPLSAWRSFCKLNRAELAAAGIALVTFFPYRIFLTAWPWYAQILGHTVYDLSRPFVSGLHYVPSLSPILTGPNLDVTILFWCSGLQSIKLFQLLFGLVLIIDWVQLNRQRALVAYIGGLGFMLVTNAGRIALIVVIGNHWHPETVIQYHLTGGWIYFTASFCLYLVVVYPWLMGQRHRTETARALNAEGGVNPVSARLLL